MSRHRSDAHVYVGTPVVIPIFGLLCAGRLAAPALPAILCRAIALT